MAGNPTLTIGTGEYRAQLSDGRQISVDWAFIRLDIGHKGVAVEVSKDLSGELYGSVAMLETYEGNLSQDREDVTDPLLVAAFQTYANSTLVAMAQQQGSGSSEN